VAVKTSKKTAFRFIGYQEQRRLRFNSVDDYSRVVICHENDLIYACIGSLESYSRFLQQSPIDIETNACILLLFSVEQFEHKGTMCELAEIQRITETWSVPVRNKRKIETTRGREEYFITFFD
jgi:hypothetical protein